MVSEGAFGFLKSRYRVFYKQCESDKETVKLMCLAAIVLHNICIERGDVMARNFDLTLDAEGNKRRSSEEIRDLLVMTRSKEINFSDSTGGRKVRKELTAYFWREKSNLSS